MILRNIPNATPVTLKVKREGTVAVFETTVIEHLDNCLVCNPMYQDDKMINFQIPGLSAELNLFDRDEGKMYAWRNIEIKAGYFRKTTLSHIIYLYSLPVEINRRNNYRQYVGIDAKATPFHRPTASVHIRDVSNNGIGFIVPDRGHFDVGKQITIKFTDGGGRFDFSLVCEIVRERELENGSIEFGCAVLNPPQSLATYVAHKQLEERKRILGMI